MTNTNSQTKTTKNTKNYDDKIASKDEQIKQLLNQKKKLVQKQKADERKQRTSRFCRRHGLLEAFMKDLANITDDQFEMFIRTGINTSYGRSKLSEIIGKGAEVATAYIEKCRAEDNARSEEEARKKEEAKNNEKSSGEGNASGNENPQQSQKSSQHNDNGNSATPPKAEQSGA